MKPEKIGRVLGIGVRVAGRVAGQRLAASANDVPTTLRSQYQAQSRAIPQVVIHAPRAAAQGVGGFVRVFRRVGGIVWLEVTGLFFLIFVPVFIWRGMWPIHAQYAHGPEHMKFLAYLGLTLVFLYLGVSSFWRAHKR